MKLCDKLVDHFRLTPKQLIGLAKLRLLSIEDMLRYYPLRYGDTSKARTVASLAKGDSVSIFGKIKSLETSKGFRTKITMAKATIEDSTGSIGIVWFNQPYIAKILHEGSKVRAEGKVSEGKHGLYLSNPKVEEVAEIPEIAGESLFEGVEAPATLYPVYRETRYISSDWIYHHIQKIFRSRVIDSVSDPIPDDILKKYSLPSLATSFVWIHSPRKGRDFEAARKRFAFEEVFLIQLQKQIERKRISEMKGVRIEDAFSHAYDFSDRLPFPLTRAQREAIKTISKEMEHGTPISRLLEGDVGSGKTAVAAATSYAVIHAHPDGHDFGNFQIAYMAPTEILATQHFESFIEYFRHLPIEMILLTGSTCRKFPSKVNPSGSTPIAKSQALKWIAEGNISLTIGTHALIQKKVKFKNLAYVIIDEQHRFGVNQRQKLARKDGVVPHLLSMTATPIPRTLALTIYGDLDLSILDEMPKGRKQIVTKIVEARDRELVYEEIEKELVAGRQLYVICPRIDEPDPDLENALEVKSVKAEAKRLKDEVFQDYRIGVLHGKMKPKDKEDIMRDFLDRRIDILCATSVVEVGVNVPNASVMIIEGAERFGLSQLHQLRGRIIRGEHQPYCYAFLEKSGDKTIARLKAFQNAKNGFELSELDMQQRGVGELGGGKQWGVSDIAMEALRNIKMVEVARLEARDLVASDPTLSQHHQLKEFVGSKHQIHFE